MAQEYVKRYLADKYEVVFSVHEDKKHVHAHIVWNSVSFMDGYKYHANNREDPDQIRCISDELCSENGLSVIENSKGKGKHYTERAAEMAGRPTIRSQLAQEFDCLIAMSYDYKHFLEQLKKRGYTIKAEPNIKCTAVKTLYSERFIRPQSIGEDYTQSGIENRIRHMRAEKYR